MNENPLMSAIRLMTGTLWHDWIGETMERQGVPVMREVNVSAGLPEGWSGTADLLTWDAEEQGFVLHDLKTTRGEGIFWIEKDGMKDDHLHQCSAYFWALVEMGFPMVPYFDVIYLPMNDAPDVTGPSVQRGKPIPRDTLYPLMESRKEAVEAYLASIEAGLDGLGPHMLDREPERYLTDALAPGLPREQKLYKKGDIFELKLVPNWRTRYCPFDPPLCDCQEQGTTKIGEYRLYVSRGYDDEEQFEGWNYTPREGYELLEPSLVPVA